MADPETRTRAVTESPVSGSSFLEKFVLLFFGFVFAAAIVGGSVYYYTERTLGTERSEIRDNRAIDQEWLGRDRYTLHLLTMQSQTFNETTQAIGGSLQTIAALTWSYDDKLGPGDLARRVDQYQRTQESWQATEIRLRALMEAYFGSAVRDEFEFEISRELNALGADVERIYLEALRRAQGPGAPVAGETGLALRSRYQDLNGRVYAFLVRLLEEIKTGHKAYGGVPPDYTFTPPLRSAPDRVPGQVE